MGWGPLGGSWLAGRAGKGEFGMCRGCKMGRSSDMKHPRKDLEYRAREQLELIHTYSHISTHVILASYSDYFPHFTLY